MYESIQAEKCDIEGSKSEAPVFIDQKVAEVHHSVQENHCYCFIENREIVHSLAVIGLQPQKHDCKTNSERVLQ